jgi:hypothetical protein
MDLASDNAVMMSAIPIWGLITTLWYRYYVLTSSHLRVVSDHHDFLHDSQSARLDLVPFTALFLVDIQSANLQQIKDPDGQHQRDEALS